MRAVTAERGGSENAGCALLCCSGFGGIAQEDGEEMSAASKRKLTPEEYLVIERAASFKSEFYRGEMFAMAGANRNHNRIFHNLSYLLQHQLKGGPCNLLGPDMRVATASHRNYFYPDLVIVCDKPQYLENSFDTLLNPQVIFEILSESTERFDRGDKFEEYRNIASLKEYILVSQDKMQITRFVRQSEYQWGVRFFKDAAGDFSLESVKVAIPIKDIYAGVEFDQAKEEANAP